MTKTIYFVFIIFIKVCYAEYLIKENVVPSYLMKTFYNLSEDIFPYDIKMSMSLSRVTGTLLYSIDSNDNQMIVSLHGAVEPTLEIEFSKQRFYVSLPQLCGCKRCRFETITLRIQMRDVMHLQCNEEITENFIFKSSKEFNKNYPLPKFNKTKKLEAHLWMVNTPYFEDLYPNNAQLYGCIFEVWYNNQIIKMESLGVGDKCTKTCTAGICNSGECLETYNHSPVCNCTSSFYNGRFCNDSIKEANYEVNRKLNFRALKFSFNSVSEDFFELRNERGSLKLSSQERNLIFVSKFNITTYIKIEVILFQKYQKKDHNILIMEFEETSVHLKFLVNGSSWIFSRIPYFHDLSREVFNNLTLQSKEGIMDIVYKSDLQETKWNRLSFKKKYFKLDPLPTTVIKKKQIVSTSSIPSSASKVKDKEGETEYFSLSNKVNFTLGLISVLIIVIIVIIVIIGIIGIIVIIGIIGIIVITIIIKRANSTKKNSIEEQHF